MTSICQNFLRLILFSFLQIHTKRPFVTVRCVYCLTTSKTLTSNNLLQYVNTIQRNLVKVFFQIFPGVYSNNSILHLFSTSFLYRIHAHAQVYAPIRSAGLSYHIVGSIIHFVETSCVKSSISYKVFQSFDTINFFTILLTNSISNNCFSRIVNKLV